MRPDLRGSEQCIPHPLCVGTCSLLSQEVVQALLECHSQCGAVSVGEPVGSAGQF